MLSEWDRMIKFNTNNLAKQEQTRLAARTGQVSQDNLPITKIKVHHKRVKSENHPVVIQKTQITSPELNLPSVEADTKLIAHVGKSFAETQECPPSSMDFYRVGKNIGKGAFGRVNIAMQLLAGRLVAIKSIDSTSFKDHSRKFMNEVSILKQARHKNIV